MQHRHADEAAPHTTGSIIRWSRLYNLFFGLKPTAQHQRVIEYAAPQPGEKALDVGCGPGALAIAMSEMVGEGGEVVGIDASLEMIETARRKTKRQSLPVRFEAAAIESLSFPGASFDLATSTFMLHHLPDEAQRAGLAEVRRVLKPGGRLVIADFASESGSLLGHLLSILGHAHGGSTFPSLESKLREAGFARVEQLKSKSKAVMFVRAS